MVENLKVVFTGNYKLIEHSLIILNNWLELDPEVKDNFLMPIDQLINETK